MGDRAWFVAVKADGSLDRSWPSSAEGREGADAVFGNDVEIVRVVPARQAREEREAVEDERDALRERVERLRATLDWIAFSEPPSPEVKEWNAIAYIEAARDALRADDEAAQ